MQKAIEENIHAEPAKEVVRSYNVNFDGKKIIKCRR